jgi:hypothetical protein
LANQPVCLLQDAIDIVRRTPIQIEVVGSIRRETSNLGVVAIRIQIWQPVLYGQGNSQLTFRSHERAGQRDQRAIRFPRESLDCTLNYPAFTPLERSGKPGR